jgi:hypothetical protein
MICPATFQGYSCTDDLGHSGSHFDALRCTYFQTEEEVGRPMAVEQLPLHPNVVTGRSEREIVLDPVEHPTAVELA